MRHRRLCQVLTMMEILLAGRALYRFLFDTPTLVPDDYEAGRKLVFDDNNALTSILSEKRRRDTVGLSASQRFRRNVFDVLFFREYKGILDLGLKNQLRTWRFFVTRFLQAIMSWTSYVTQIVFPFVTLGFLACVYAKDANGENVYCYLQQGSCHFERENYFRPG